MRSFAQKGNHPQNAFYHTPPRLATLRPDHREHSALQSLRAPGNQALQRIDKPNLEEVKTGATRTAQPHAASDMSGIPIHSRVSRVIGPSIPITERGDEYELEPERFAEQVMKTRELPSVREWDGSYAGCQPRQLRQVQRRIQTKSSEDGGHNEAPPIAPEVFPSAGQPLDQTTRDFMEPRFGRDFSAVRVHTDESAAVSTRRLNAAAFTVGADIAFAPGRYAPASVRGRALLAHELTHVVQQMAGPRFLARQTVQQYETKGIKIDPDKLDEMAALSYWEQKIGARFQLSTDPSADARFKDKEERAAVLSVVFQMLPGTAVTREATNVVTIPKRAGVRGSQNLVYQIIFRPRARPTDPDVVVVRFVNEGRGATAVTPDPPSTRFTRSVGYTPSGFPLGDATRFWQAHPDAERQVFSWIEKEAPAPKFDQLITTRVGSGKTAQSVSFQVKGKKEVSNGDLSNVTVTFLGEVAPSAKTVSAGYAAERDFAEESIEEVRTPADPKQPDKLGQIKGLAVVPKKEWPSVKYAISQYFKGGTRNAEVDAIVPIVEGALFTEVTTDERLSPAQRDMAGEFATSGVRLFPARRVLYTFRFKPNSKDAHISDVEVQRIGQEGKDVSLTPQGDLSRVNGFLDHTKGATEADRVKALKDWLKKRYRGVTPTGATVAEIEKDVTAKIRAGSDDPAWFEKNYDIKILDETKAKARLKSIGHDKPKQLQDLSKFSKLELQMLESVLEKMSDDIVKTFKDLSLIRQKTFNEHVGPGPNDFETKPDTGGITITGSTRTTIIFDAASASADSLFLGGIGPDGKPAVGVHTSLAFAHELGHTAAKQLKVQKAFDQLVIDKNIQPITWYAASNPPKELFAESFALYYSDPVWLKQNWPDLHRFFETLDKTGKPPP